MIRFVVIFLKIQAKEESNIVRYNCISVSKRFVMKIINAYPIKIIFL